MKAWGKLYRYPRAKYNSVTNILGLNEGILISGNLGTSNNWIALIKKAGAISWQKMSKFFDVSDGVIKSKNMSLVVGNKDIETLLLGFDMGGTVAWGTRYRLKRSKTRNLRAISLLQGDSKQEFFFVGEGELPREYWPTPIVWKSSVGTGGRVFWAYLYRPNSEKFGYSITFRLSAALKYDTNLFILGEIEHWSEGDVLRQDIWVMKLDTEGNVIWSEKYGKRGFVFNVYKITYFKDRLILVGDVIIEGQKRFPFVAYINSSGKLDAIYLLRTSTPAGGYGIEIFDESLILVGEEGADIYSYLGGGEYGWIVQLNHRNRVISSYRFKDMSLFDVRFDGHALIFAGKKGISQEQGLLMSIPQDYFRFLDADSTKIRLEKVNVRRTSVSIVRHTVGITNSSINGISFLEEGKAVSKEFNIPLKLKTHEKGIDIIESLNVLSSKERRLEVIKSKSKSQKGYDFEVRIANVLRAVGLDVKTTRKSRDYGADIILELGPKKIAIQCKDTKKAIGVRAIQEVLGGKAYYRCDEAWVISTGGFTKEAKELARVANVKLFTRISDILRMLGY